MQVKEKGNKDPDPDPSKQSNNDIIGSSLINTTFYSSTMRSCTGNNFNRQEILLAIQTPDLIQQVKGMLTSHVVKELIAFTNPAAILECFHTIQPGLLILESPWNNNTSTLEAALT